MPKKYVLSLAKIGKHVQVMSGAFAGQPALVIACHLVHPRLLLGGSLDRPPQVPLRVLTEQGDNLWLGNGEVVGLGQPDRMSCFLPHTGGEQVLVISSGARGEVCGWTVTVRRLGVEEVHPVHLAGTPSADELEVDTSHLALWQ